MTNDSMTNDQQGLHKVSTFQNAGIYLPVNQCIEKQVGLHFCAFSVTFVFVDVVTNKPAGYATHTWHS